RNRLPAAGAFRGPTSARVVEQHPAHRLGGERKEMIAVLAHALLIQHPQESLVYQRGGAECVVAPFAPKLSSCQRAKLIVDERHQHLGRGSTAITPFSEQIGELIAGGVAHVHHPGRFKTKEGPGFLTHKDTICASSLRMVPVAT